MGVDRFGNTTCDVCGIKIFNGVPFANRMIGKDGYAMCSPECLQAFEDKHQQVSEEFEAAMAKATDRAGMDEQKGWGRHRWWNQTYKRKKDVYQQWKTQREFEAIQRKARREARRRK